MKPADGAPGPRGRPKDVEKSAAILKAARGLFFARGFEAVSLEGVAAGAGVARMTVYSHFGDKETLFAAVVSDQAARLSAALRGLSPAEVAAADDSAEHLRRDLAAFGVGLLGFLGDPETRAFNRLIEAQARQMPNLARAFSDSGPRAVMARLAERLAAANSHGSAAVEEPRRAACQFIGLLRSIEALATLEGWPDRPGPDAIARHVDDCVERFARGFLGAPDR